MASKLPSTLVKVFLVLILIFLVGFLSYAYFSPSSPLTLVKKSSTQNQFVIAPQPSPKIRPVYKRDVVQAEKCLELLKLIKDHMGEEIKNEEELKGDINEDGRVDFRDIEEVKEVIDQKEICEKFLKTI